MSCAQLSMVQARLAYRSPYLGQVTWSAERAPLSFTPLSLERDDHTTGLIDG